MRPLNLSLVRVLVGVGLLLGLAPAAASAKAPIGFKVDLADGAHIECSWFRSALTCLDYSPDAEIVEPATCDFGGQVPGVTINKRGSLVSVTLCVDEGFHGWKRLRPGKTFRKGAISCRLSKPGSELKCRNRSGTFLVAGPLLAPSNPAGGSCKSIVFTPNSEDGASKIAATGVSCDEAGELVRAVAANHNFYDGPRSFASGDWACTVETDDTALPVGHYACKRGEAFVSWDKT
jgi:hypothetical protein